MQKEACPEFRVEQGPDVLIPKHDSRIIRQSSNPVSGSWKSQARGQIQKGKKPLEKPPESENPPETKFLFYDMSKLPIFGLFPV